MTPQVYSLCVEIGGVSVAFHLVDAELAKLIEERYADFLVDCTGADFAFQIETVHPSVALGDPDADVDVRRDGLIWRLSRGDFRAEWDIENRRGLIRQTANPYSIDSVLRIVHTLVLAPQGGFLLHASSAIRNGAAFLFSGASGAGKTTISRLAPPDVTLLTDEISYVRVCDARQGAHSGYLAYGTPFAGDLAKPGANVKAPVAALYLIEHGLENRIEDIQSPVEAARALLDNILFFAHSPQMVAAVFDSALEFVRKTPIKRLKFLPDARVWELIR